MKNYIQGIDHIQVAAPVGCLAGVKKKHENFMVKNRYGGNPRGIKETWWMLV